MRRRVAIGAAMLAMAGLLLSGCGGVPQADLDAAEEATATAEAATAALETELTAAEAALDAAKAERAPLREELTDLQWTIIELEDAAADRAEAAAEAEAAAGPLSFASWTYTNTEYGFTLQITDEWEVGSAAMTYAPALVRIGYVVAWNVPALGLYAVGDEEPSEDPEADVREGETFSEMISITPAVLSDGTAVTVFAFTLLDGGRNVSMTVWTVNGTPLNFTIDSNPTSAPMTGGVEAAIEMLLSLVIDADLIE